MSTTIVPLAFDQTRGSFVEWSSATPSAAPSDATGAAAAAPSADTASSPAATSPAGAASESQVPEDQRRLYAVPRSGLPPLMVRPNSAGASAVRDAAVAADAAAAAAAAQAQEQHQASVATSAAAGAPSRDNNRYTVVVKAPQLKAGGLGAMSEVRFASSGGGGGRVSKDNWRGNGAQVMRGGDWKWADQDGGAGKRGLIKQENWSDWVSVRWDNDHSNSYRCGAEEAYDLVYA